MKRQGGYTILTGLLAMLGLAAGGMGAYVWYAERAMRDNFAEIEGQALSQFAVGLRGFVADVQADPSRLPSNPYIVTGVNWLKPPTCGGLERNPPEGYVPCAFTGQTMGPQYTTRITRNALNNQVEARTYFTVPAFGGDARSRSVLADKVVEAALRQQSLPANGMFYEAFANVPVEANAPIPPLFQASFPQVRGQVLLLVNNAPNNDLWLRTDGTNQMRANVNLGGFSIGNARDGRFRGNVRVEGVQQVDGGLAVTNGLGVFRGGAIATDMLVEALGDGGEGSGRFVSSAIYDVYVLSGNTQYTVPKPNCTRAGNQPAIFTAYQGTGNPNPNGYFADAIYDARIIVQDQGSSWLVRPAIAGTRFGLSLVGNDLTLTKQVLPVVSPDTRIVVMTQCR
jgi:hypothetical protein